MAFGNPDLDITAMTNPQWAKWLDMAKAAGGGKDIEFAGGPSAEGSSQIRGTSVQPSLSGLQSLLQPRADTPTAYTPSFDQPLRPKRQGPR